MLFMACADRMILGLSLDVLGKIRQVYTPVFTECRRNIKNIEKFADIARPIVPPQRQLRFGGNDRSRTRIRRAFLQDFREQPIKIAAVPQRRQ